VFLILNTDDETIAGIVCSLLWCFHNGGIENYSLFTLSDSVTHFFLCSFHIIQNTDLINFFSFTYIAQLVQWLFMDWCIGLPSQSFLFFSTQRPERFVGPFKPLSNIYSLLCPWRQSRQGVKLTSYICLAPVSNVWEIASTPPMQRNRNAFVRKSSLNFPFLRNYKIFQTSANNIPVEYASIGFTQYS